jgi:hypothetical protein
MNSQSVFLNILTLSALLAWPVAGAETCGATAEGMKGAAGFIKGTVVATTNASRYTYVQIDTGKEKIWAAGPTVAIKVGDAVSIQGGMRNKDFYSQTLKRKFDDVYFVEAIHVGGSACQADAAKSGMPPHHPALTSAEAPASADSVIEVLQKPKGGKTVAEVWAEKTALSGKQVVVRAKVVKVVSNILGKNFLHLRDGSGSEGNNDLTVTTKDKLKVGQIVTATGLITTDKDFGSGYRYDVIMEDATVTIP